MRDRLHAFMFNPICSPSTPLKTCFVVIFHLSTLQVAPTALVRANQINNEIAEFRMELSPGSFQEIEPILTNYKVGPHQLEMELEPL